MNIGDLDVEQEIISFTMTNPPTEVMHISEEGIWYQPIKEYAIEEIITQPFFGRRAVDKEKADE